MRARWINYPGGAYVELARGLRATCTMDRTIKRYRVSFAGVGWDATFGTLNTAKRAAMRLTADIVSEILLAILELEYGGDNGHVLKL